MPLVHHPWCNWNYRPFAGCAMCERLYREYPLLDRDGNLIEDIAAVYFPDVVRVADGEEGGA